MERPNTPQYSIDFNASSAMAQLAWQHPQETVQYRAAIQIQRHNNSAECEKET